MPARDRTLDQSRSPTIQIRHLRPPGRCGRLASPSRRSGDRDSQWGRSRCRSSPGTGWPGPTGSGDVFSAISSTYAQEVVNLTPAKAAMFTSFFAIFNGIGRPIFGSLTDNLGTKKTITLSYSLIITAGVLSILFRGNAFIFGLAFAIIWLNLGGWLAIVPASTVNLFGKSHYSANYGILFTAYGIGALSQGFVGGAIKETFGSYVYIFYPVIGMCILGLLISHKFIHIKKVHAHA